MKWEASFKEFVERVRAGEVTRQEVLDRLLTAMLLVAAVAVVLTRLSIKATRTLVETHGPTVSRVVGELLSRSGEALKERST